MPFMASTSYLDNYVETISADYTVIVSCLIVTHSNCTSSAGIQQGREQECRRTVLRRQFSSIINCLITIEIIVIIFE